MRPKLVSKCREHDVSLYCKIFYRNEYSKRETSSAIPTGGYNRKVGDEYVKELIFERAKVLELIALKSSDKNLQKTEFPIILLLFHMLYAQFNFY